MRSVRLLSIPMLLCAAHAAHADAKVCKAGALVFGNPLYVHKSGDQPNPAGQTVRQDPPLAWESPTFSGDKVFSTNNQEVWGGPMNGAIKRIAGQEESQARFAEGPCADARFGNIWGIALTRDGSIIVADHDANAILTITDPEKPTCKVSVLVGAKKALADATQAPSGDTDGPAASAAIAKPAWPVVDGSGNIYFVDGGTNKVKMIASDAAHTVSSLGQLRNEREVEKVHGMTMLDDKLYTVTSTVANGIIQEVDPATKKVRTIKDAGSAGFAPMESNHSPALSAIASDGSALLVFGRGYIWRVTPDGHTTHVAGSGWDIEFPKGYNPAGVYPSKQLKLFYKFSMGRSGSSTYLAWHNNAVYWRGVHGGPYVVKLTCP